MKVVRTQHRRSQILWLILCLLGMQGVGGVEGVEGVAFPFSLRDASGESLSQDPGRAESSRRREGERGTSLPAEEYGGPGRALPVGIDLIEGEAGATWHLTGPFGGDVTTLAIDPRNPDRLLCGTADGQLFQSLDGGEIWRSLHPGIQSPGGSISVIHFDRDRRGTIYVGVHPVLIARDKRAGLPIGGLFLSEDDAKTWRPVESLQGLVVRGLSQSASQPSILVVATFHGLFRSRNRGLDWERITPETHRDLRAGIHSVAIDPQASETIYVGTHHLPWKSVDGGASWSLAGSAETGMLDDSDIFSIYLDETHSEHVLMSACSGIYRSIDGSRRWTKIQGIPFSSRRTHHILPHPTRPEQLFAATTEGLWVSLARGSAESWQRVTSERMVVNRVVIHPSRPERIFLATEDHGILRSLDGGASFTSSHDGFFSRQISALHADRLVPGRVYAGILFDQGQSGLFVSEDGGMQWRRSMVGMTAEDVYSIYQPEERPNRLYVGTNRGLFRSDDQGGSWQIVERVPAVAAALRRPTPAKRPAVPQPKRTGAAARRPPVKVLPPPPSLVDLRDQVFSLAPLRPLPPRTGTTTSTEASWMIASTWNGLFVSEDEAKGWRKLSLLESRTSGREPHIHTVVTHPRLPGWILVGTDAGLFLSQDNGMTFLRRRLPEPLARIRRLAIDPSRPTTLYAGTTAGFFRSLDGGETWEGRGGGMPLHTDIGALLFSPESPWELYVADDLRGTLYHSTDAGTNWAAISLDRLPSTLVRSLIVDPFDPRRFYLGTFSGGVYVLTRPPTRPHL